MATRLLLPDDEGAELALLALLLQDVGVLPQHHQVRVPLDGLQLALRQHEQTKKYTDNQEAVQGGNHKARAR